MNTTTNPDGMNPLLKDRLALSRAEVAQLLGVSETLAYRLMKQGGLTPIPAGRRKIVPVAALVEWLKTGNALATSS